MKKLVFIISFGVMLISCGKKEYRYEIHGKVYVPTSGLNPMHDAIWYTDTISFDGDTIYYFNRPNEMKIGITCSCFDLFHAGHVKMLEEAKSQCDYLIIALQTDPTIDRPEKNKPVQSVVERYIQLKGCKFVDEIIPYETEKDLEDIFKTLKLDVRIIGEDYKGKDFTAKQICLDRSIVLYYNERKHNFSSTELKKRIQNGKN